MTLIVQGGVETLAELERHNVEIRRPVPGRICYRTSCPRCLKAGPFGPHELRPRSLRVIVDNAVHCKSVIMGRWNCRDCEHGFTDYPPFRTAV